MLKPSEVLADLYETNNLIGPPGPPTPKTALALRRKKALLGLLNVQAAEQAADAPGIARCRGFAAELAGEPAVFPIDKQTQPEALAAAFESQIGRLMAQGQPLSEKDEVAILMREAFALVGSEAQPLPHNVPDGWTTNPLLPAFSFYVQGGATRGFLVAPDASLRGALASVNGRDLPQGQFSAFLVQRNKDGAFFLGSYAEQGAAEQAVSQALAS
jgi:hypothetical protein